MFQILFILFILGTYPGTILTLNQSEYIRMPPIYHLDPYEQCIYEPGGIYCSVKISLVPDGPSELYSLIQNYSANTYIHYNHSRLDYGICLTKTCKKIYEQNKTDDQRFDLERCLNDSFWENYKLKTQVSDPVFCDGHKEDIKLDIKDRALLTVIGAILMLNVIGSFRQFYLGNDEQDKDFLACYSIQRNWRALVAPCEGSDGRLNRLKGFHGVRSIIMILAILTHGLTQFFISGDNPLFVEEAYGTPLVIMASGHVIIQINFVLSGLILSYNLQLYKEKHSGPSKWSVFTKAIMFRWMRLTGVYVFVIALSVTLMRHAGDGPLGQAFIMNQFRDCQRYWWAHLFYFNNYIDNSYCLPETWYIAADMQLYIVGVLVCVLFEGRRRQMALVVLFIIGLVTPAVHTYFHDLDGFILFTPEHGRDVSTFYPTFDYATRGHTNITSFVIGLVLGLIVYYCQNTNYIFPNFIKLCAIVSVPVLYGIIQGGTIFLFYDKAPLRLRVVYSVLIRPVISFFAATGLLGIVFKLEDTFRRLFEWSGWVVCGRVSLCVYLINMTVIRVLSAQHTTLIHSTVSLWLTTCFNYVVSSYIAGILMFLLIEAPLSQLIKLKLSAREKNVSDVNQSNDNKNVKTE